ncbi:IPT/TIG domain-containing protein [Dysgonomonas sp. 511]|uniref:IPT/TIG domain-containing protein n=1 Tax=Dysgonomonas sp. 511 TaxID=2302930 RepID=UPI0013D66156|nr:IPT/TIG domain-containing protein [Dysgonomonas sp. 511]NDV77398.1 hypothetical protein [Dysgonomonas sp. 511]
MKFTKIYNRFILMMLAILAISFTACSDDDDSSGSVVLEAYGPSPALRGGQLTFVGKNMDKVTKVILPDNIEITDIEVVSSERIKVTIPQNAAEGYVQIVTPNGILTSKTLLTYTEPITITSLSPSPVKPGETLTIEGDYLNLMKKVIFAEDVEVANEDFITWERSKIELVVPAEARTGKITLSDMATIPVELESEMELQVVLPSVNQIVDLTDKKPGDKITVTGKDLDLVEYVVLPNGAAGDTVDFEVQNDQLSFTLSPTVANGAIVMIPASGVHVTVANIGMAVPAELVATPASDIKASTVITITGKNMDLVTTVTFPGVSDPATPSSQSTTEIKVTAPDGTTSGNLTLNTASGNTATVAITTLKPAVTSYSPSSVAAGSDVTINGTNLDLVAKVTFGGGKTVEVTPGAATAITVAIPVDAETGELTLTMTNGETVKSQSLTITKPEFCYIPVLPGSDTDIAPGSILAIEVQNENKLTGVKVNGSTVQYILQGTLLNVAIPTNALGDTQLTLTSSNGEITYDIYVKGAGPIITSVWSGVQDMGGWSGSVQIANTQFGSVEVGDIIKVTVDPSSLAADSQGSLKTGSSGWPAIAPGTEYFNISGDFTLEVTQDIKAALQSTGLIVSGQKYIATDVSFLRY